MNKKVLGKKIQLARKSKGLTQAKLAELLGIEPPSVTRWEKGGAAPRASLVPKLESILDIEVYPSPGNENESDLEERLTALEAAIKSDHKMALSKEETELVEGFRKQNFLLQKVALYIATGDVNHIQEAKDWAVNRKLSIKDQKDFERVLSLVNG